MPRTGSSPEKQEGMAVARSEHYPVKKDQMPRTGSSGAGRAAEAAIQGQVAARRPGLDHPGADRLTVQEMGPAGNAGAGPVIQV